MHTQHAARSAGRLIVISAPSGSGKGTVIGEFQKLGDSAGAELSVSVTSRAPRKWETEGVHYFFVPESRFKDMIRQSSFIEWDEYCGNYYGTSKDYVLGRLAAGKDVIFDITIKGAFAIKRQFPEAILVFIVPPSFGELRRRLTRRGTESEAAIEGRLAAAKEEIRQIGRFDYYIVNDVAAAAAGRLSAIVAAEKCRISSPEQAERIIAEHMGPGP
ncbi:MAG: guanylate kinase [Clostridiales bacterium]|nr:guanylate kinase [Clostridiales bacterium]